MFPNPKGHPQSICQQLLKAASSSGFIQELSANAAQSQGKKWLKRVLCRCPCAIGLQETKRCGTWLNNERKLCVCVRARLQFPWYCKLVILNVGYIFLGCLCCCQTFYILSFFYLLIYYDSIKLNNWFCQLLQVLCLHNIKTVQISKQR